MSRQLPQPREALKILRESGCSSRVIRHCKAVAELAVRMADECERNGIEVDVQLVQIGALLHDLGRSKTHSVHHAVVGAEIARSLGLPNSVVSIIERHVGGGITAEEASRLGWPSKSYVPETLEEKIISYADKLIEDAKVVPVEKTLQRFSEELGIDHPAVKRILNLHKEISDLCHKAAK